MKTLLFKKLSVLLPLALMLGTSFYCQADDYLYADVNRDGEVNISDVNAVIDAILGKPVTPPQLNKTFTVNGVSFTMVQVKGGTFVMGANDDDSEAFSDEFPTRVVKLSDYYIGETEVTQELWEAVMGTRPSTFTGNKFPVERVSWDDCKEFIRRLNTITGMHFRLPTEAEWEYAARGGNKSNGYKYSGSDNINEVALWTGNNMNYSTQTVGRFSPNELGIYDMSGNVFEWCEDWYGAYPAPVLITSVGMILFEDIPLGASESTTSFTISGYQLSDDVYLSVQGEGFSISRQFIGVKEANSNSIRIDVTYSGPRDQSAEGLIKITSRNAQDQNVSLRYHCPALEIIAGNPIKLENLASPSATFKVIGYNLSGNISLDIDRNDFSITPNSIKPDNGNVNTDVTVTYLGELNTEPKKGTITISANGLPDQTIDVIAQLNPTLDIVATNPLIMENTDSATFTIMGSNLIEDVTITIDGEGFLLTPTSITPDGNGNVYSDVTVTYSDTLGAEPKTGIITISSTGLVKTLEVVAQPKGGSRSQGNNCIVSMTIVTENTNDNYEGFVDVNPNGPSSGLYRIMRGGAWNSQSRFCRNSYRFSRESSFKHFAVGLRIAM